MQDRLDRNTLVLPSPAKLNLMLHILGRREDGYHELQTLFQFLDYGDEMTFAVREDGVICLHTEFPGVAHDDNLIVRAAKKLQAQSACPLGTNHLEATGESGGGIGADCLLADFNRLVCRRRRGNTTTGPADMPGRGGRGSDVKLRGRVSTR